MNEPYMTRSSVLGKFTSDMNGGDVAMDEISFVSISVTCIFIFGYAEYDFLSMSGVSIVSNILFIYTLISPVISCLFFYTAEISF